MPRPIDRTVSDHVSARMFALREERGIGRAALAAAMNMSEPSLYYYETGKRRVTVDALITVSGLLDKPIGYFFEGLDDVRPAAMEVTPSAAPAPVPVKAAVKAAPAKVKPARKAPDKTQAGRPKAATKAKPVKTAG